MTKVDAHRRKAPEERVGGWPLFKITRKEVAEHKDSGETEEIKPTVNDSVETASATPVAKVAKNAREENREDAKAS